MAPLAALPLVSPAVPRWVTPSRKVTTPVAVSGDTVATSSISSEKLAGLSDDERLMVVGAFLTLRRTVADVLWS